MASDKTSDLDQRLNEVQSKELERYEEIKNTIDLSELVITFAPPNE